MWWQKSRLMRRCSQDSKTLTARAVCALLLAAIWTLANCVLPSDKAEPVVLKRAQMHMGTLVKITAVAQTEAIAQIAITAGFQEIHRLEELLSTWISTSELSRVNALAGREPVKVSRDTLAILKRSLEIAKLTDGGFNIAIGPAVEAWSVMDRQHIPEEAELQTIRPLVDLSAITLDESGGTVFLARSGMRVDIGGIGKGYAADMAAKAMQRAGATGGVVALSGDIKTFGQSPDGSHFSFGIQHPREQGAVLAFVNLQEEAISTAGDYERFFEKDGVRYHHILDPLTLRPARGCQSVTVVAREGTMADGLDTGLFVMGPQRAMELVERLPGVEAIIIDQAGRILVSSGLKGRVHIVQETH